jgi:hypothetical protein
MSDASSLTLQVVSAAAVFAGFSYWVVRIFESLEHTRQVALQRVPVRAERRRR